MKCNNCCQAPHKYKFKTHISFTWVRLFFTTQITTKWVFPTTSQRTSAQIDFSNSKDEVSARPEDLISSCIDWIARLIGLKISIGIPSPPRLSALLIKFHWRKLRITESDLKTISSFFLQLLKYFCDKLKRWLKTKKNS